MSTTGTTTETNTGDTTGEYKAPESIEDVQKLLSDQVQQDLAPRLRYLLALDDPRNDQLSRQEVTRSGFLR